MAFLCSWLPAGLASAAGRGIWRGVRLASGSPRRGAVGGSLAIRHPMALCWRRRRLSLSSASPATSCRPSRRDTMAALASSRISSRWSPTACRTPAGRSFRRLADDDALGHRESRRPDAPTSYGRRHGRASRERVVSPAASRAAAQAPTSHPARMRALSGAQSRRCSVASRSPSHPRIREGRDESIALAGDRGDEARMPVVVLELDAQAPDVAIDDVALGHEVGAPDGIEDLFPRDDAPAPTGEEVQQALLDAAQVHDRVDRRAPGD